MALACDICYEFYTDMLPGRIPRLLPRCGHDFCSQCIVMLCETERSPTCPKCRASLFSSTTAASFAASTTVRLRALVSDDMGGRSLNDKGAFVSSERKKKYLCCHGNHSATAHSTCDVNCDALYFPIVRGFLQLGQRLDFTQLTPFSLDVLRHALETCPLQTLEQALVSRQPAGQNATGSLAPYVRRPKMPLRQHKKLVANAWDVRSFFYTRRAKMRSGVFKPSYSLLPFSKLPLKPVWLRRYAIALPVQLSVNGGDELRNAGGRKGLRVSRRGNNTVRCSVQARWVPMFSQKPRSYFSTVLRSCRHLCCARCRYLLLARRLGPNSDIARMLPVDSQHNSFRRCYVEPATGTCYKLATPLEKKLASSSFSHCHAQPVLERCRCCCSSWPTMLSSHSRSSRCSFISGTGWGRTNLNTRQPGVRCAECAMPFHASQPHRHQLFCSESLYPCSLLSARHPCLSSFAVPRTVSNPCGCLFGGEFSPRYSHYGCRNHDHSCRELTEVPAPPISFSPQGTVSPRTSNRNSEQHSRQLFARLPPTTSQTQNLPFLGSMAFMWVTQLWTSTVLFLYICLRVLRSACHFIVESCYQLYGMEKEQQLQLIMIANAIPLFIASLYICHNPTFFTRLLWHPFTS